MNHSAAQILRGNPHDSQVRELIAELDAFGLSLYPVESNHFDPPEALVGENACFLIATIETAIVGCGAIKHCGDWGEVKRMYLKPEARGRGIASKLLEELLSWARSKHLSVVRLETGPLNDGALRLYRAFGFREIDAFPPYGPDPLCVFMELRL